MTAPHPAQQYADASGFPVEDRTRELVAQCLAAVYSGATWLEVGALLDALEERGLRIVAASDG